MKIWDSENGRSTKQKLDTITVWELMNNKFYIPDYQRGYRWSSFEVKKLLEDLSEYINNDKTGQSFYCMQPLVVFYKEEKGAWEVIDGQQRLTTLYLILYQKRKRLKEDNPDMELFSLSYKSRPGSEKFLEEINFNQREENIDYYHICNALDEIEIYFGKINSGKYVDYILNAKDEKGNPSVKFIWYDVTEEIAKGKISSEEIFSRLNVGKIGLTNAELIKALFLNRVDKEVKNYDEKFKERISFSLKTKISKDWDMIEHGLQKNDFWSFIYGKEDYKYDTRIEFLFDVIKDKTVTQRDIEYYTFDKYVEDFKKYDEYEKKIKDATDEQSRDIIRKEMSSYSVERKWDELMKKYYLFRNWYEDRYLYHLIGYLRYKEISIKDIISLEDTIETHSEFIEKLRKWCVALALNVESSGIEDFYNNKSSTEVKDFIATTLQTFNYGTTPNKIIYDTLLLFNVLTALDCKKMNVKFLFNEFYDTKSWDLEHIRSQTPKTTDGNDRQDWILTNLGYFSGVAFPFELRHEEKTRTDQVKGFIEKIKEQFPKLEKEIAIQPRGTQEGKSAKYVCEKLISLLNSSESITETPIYKELSSQFINEENAGKQ